METPPVREPVLRVHGPLGREALRALAARALPEGRVLAQVVDHRSEGEACVTVPLDPTARLVAVESPLVLPDGGTELVTYVDVDERALGAVQYRLMAAGAPSASVVTLAPFLYGAVRAAGSDAPATLR